MILWVLQDLPGYQDLSDAVLASGEDVLIARVRPFEDNIVVVNHEGPAVLYGSTILPERVSGRCIPGMFYNRSRFSFFALRNHYGKHLLNHDSQVMSLSAFMTANMDPESFVFIRPVHDLKEFPGAVGTVGGSRKRIGGQLRWVNGPTPETLIQVCAPNWDIESEFRLFMVGSQVVASSSYRHNRAFNLNYPVPKEVLDFGRKMAKVYSPNEVFALDIARLDSGELRVIETGCFNCAGTYSADITAIVHGVNQYLHRVYG